MKKSAKSFLSLAFCMSMLVTSGMSLQASADEMCIATNSHYQTVEDITMKPINPSNSENDVYKIAEIPDNQAPVYDGNNSNGNGMSVNANDVFHSEEFTGQDQTGWATVAGGYLELIARFISNTCVYIFAAFLTIVCVVDAVIIPFPIVGQFFATKVPIQLFSNEAAEVAGVTFTPSGENGSSGGMGGSSNSSGNANGDTKSKYKTYLIERSKALIFSGVLMFMTYTGILSVLLNKAIDFIVGFFV